jgi:phosphohistidine phosphatase SixA
MKLNKKNIIVTGIGIYHRAIETATNIYFVCFEESDENVNVKMYDRKMKLVCDNIHAHNSLFELLETGKYSWMSKKMKENLEMSK